MSLQASAEAGLEPDFAPNASSPGPAFFDSKSALEKCPAQSMQPPTLSTRTHTAYIVEPRCIGCFRCIKVCPEQAILGASRFMHTVLQALCTGCAHCLEACPVDCIEMYPVNTRTKATPTMNHDTQPAPAVL